MKNDNELNAQRIQQQFFNRVKDKHNSNISWIDTLAELLKISPDAAYRRARGEKLLTLDEILLLSKIYKVSLEDSYNELSDNQVIAFNVRMVDEESFKFADYLNSLLGHMNRISGAESAQIIYFAKDIPIFYNYCFDEIAIFKNFMWKKSVIGLKSLSQLKFSISKCAVQEELNIGRKIYENYCRIPSIEFWNEETVFSLLRQIEFYYSAELFESPNEVKVLLDRLTQLLNIIEQNAAEGFKISNAELPNTNVSFDIYLNDLVVCDNSSLVSINHQKHVFIVHNTINYIHLDNKAYCDASFKWAENLLKRSSQISRHSEQARRSFFNKLHMRVNNVKERLN